jgi:hypothetical protein
MNIDELINQFGDLPEKLDVSKMSTLLKKRSNSLEITVDLKAEVKDWLDKASVIHKELLIKLPSGDSLTALSLNDQVVLVLVDDYYAFNNKTQPADIATKIHLELSSSFRVIWCKKFEWEHPRKRNVLQSLVLHALNLTKSKVFARNTECFAIEGRNLRGFFDNNSFYGYRNGPDAVCLRDKKSLEVLLAMSFGHPYYGQKKYGDNAIECIRAASKTHLLVTGGMTKLLKFYLEEVNPSFKTMIYYVDDAHYSSGSMTALEFKLSHMTGSGVHNVWPETGAMFMRSPDLHKEIMYLQSLGEIVGVPDVGNSVYTLTRN